jgi:hypothetical protein
MSALRKSGQKADYREAAKHDLIRSMQPAASRTDWQLGVLLRGEPDSLRAWTEAWSAEHLSKAFLIIVLGAGLYGGVMGCWRAPMQALFVAIKFPLIILLTTLGNAVLNGMLAPLLGLRVAFRQSFLAILLSFVIAAAILGSFSPLVLFLVWNAPPIIAQSNAANLTYSLMLLMQVAIIALAGTIANLRLLQLVREISRSAAVARRVLIAWLAGNLFLGSQVCWILRPFIGSPNLPVQFLREEAFRGNFYEAVLHSLMQVVNSNY